MATILIDDSKITENTKNHINLEEFKYASTVIDTFIEAFVADNYADSVHNKSFFLKSKKNNKKVGFSLGFDFESKNLNSITLFSGEKELDSLNIEDLDTLSTNEDIIDIFCEELEIS